MAADGSGRAGGNSTHGVERARQVVSCGAGSMISKGRPSYNAFTRSVGAASAPKRHKPYRKSLKLTLVDDSRLGAFAHNHSWIGPVLMTRPFAETAGVEFSRGVSRSNMLATFFCPSTSSSLPYAPHNRLIRLPPHTYRR